MRNDLERPVISAKPLVGEVERPEGSSKSADQDRDEDILLMLRRKLSQRNLSDTLGQPSARKDRGSEEDKYEPQRLSRKICWQYDGNARKVPLLRRHYI